MAKWLHRVGPWMVIPSASPGWSFQLSRKHLSWAFRSPKSSSCVVDRHFMRRSSGAGSFLRPNWTFVSGMSANSRKFYLVGPVLEIIALLGVGSQNAPLTRLIVLTVCSVLRLTEARHHSIIATFEDQPFPERSGIGPRLWIPTLLSAGWGRASSMELPSWAAGSQGNMTS